MKFKKQIRLYLLLAFVMVITFAMVGCKKKKQASTVAVIPASENQVTEAKTTEAAKAQDRTEVQTEAATQEVKTEVETEAKTEEVSTEEEIQEGVNNYVQYYFRNNKLLTQHYEKHGIDMGFDSKESYQQAASDVVNNPNALHKTEAEDGDDVYYVEASNEFVVVSTDGYIRTYFLPDSGKRYYDKQ